MKDLRYEQRGAVVLITMDRPAVMNAIIADMRATMRAGLYEAFEHFEADDTALVAILTGAGDQAFCAGMDLKEAAMNGLAVPPPGFLPIIGQCVQLSKPTIAAVNGVAYAGGWLFAQMCDLCVAAEHARFGITEARVGQGMPWAAPLVNMVQQRGLMELMLTAEPIGAQRAKEIGFVNHVVPAADLLPKCFALAEKIAAKAPLTVRAARELIYLSAERVRPAAQRAATHRFDGVYRSANAQEGPLAFREKRKPQWKGR
jgi:enoyl-CoA hydratase